MGAVRGGGLGGGGGGGVVGGVQVGSLGAIDYDDFAGAADTDGRGLPEGRTWKKQREGERQSTYFPCCKRFASPPITF